MMRKQLALFLQNYEKEIRDSARELLPKEMPALTEELFGLYETTGNRLKYEEVYFARRKMLTVLGMRAILGLEEQWEEKQTYIQKLEEVILDICREETWALPAHVNRRENPQWRITVDLFASETAQTLSELMEFLGETISAEVWGKMRENIEERIFQPYFTSEVPYKHKPWECGSNNWNAVCAGSIGSACLHLMKGQPERLGASLSRIINSLTYYINGFAEDGACMEGLAYYYYGMTYFTNFAQELYDATEGETDLFCGKWGEFEGGEDRRYQIAHFPVKCFFPDGKCLSFSDGDTEGWFRVGVSSVLAMHYGKPGMSEEALAAALFPDMSKAGSLHSDTCYRFAALKMDLIQTRRFLALLEASDRKEGAFERPKAYILPSAQWYIAHSGAKVSFACKGGHNDEPHNHNDVGHFIYEGRGEMFLTDLGAGEYTRDYFSEKRYQILCNNSFGHSVPVIGGEGQGTGKEYGCSRFSADSDGRVCIEMHGAYPEGALKELQREFHFDTETGKLLVRDCFTFDQAKGAEARENLITQIRPVAEENKVLLETEKGTCTVEVEGLEGSIEIREYDHSNHQGVTEKVYGIAWPAAAADGRAQSRFCVTTQWK